MNWLASLAIAAGVFARSAVAQSVDWQDGQVNTTMCYWDSPRAAVIRDTLYIDGGNQYWLPGLSNGSYADPVSDGNPLGLVYLLNFNTSFATTGGFNLTTIFTTQSKASGSGSANNIGPQYVDGTMFANDYEWITYGGLLMQTDVYSQPLGSSYAEYQAYANGPPKQFIPGYELGTLPTGTTRYITNGAGVSVPSENLGFYFGGLQSATGGPIYQSPASANASLRADIESLTLISVDMSNQNTPVWKNDSLPTAVPGRAGAELVWVPVSTRGILVAIGGVVDPSYAAPYNKDNASQIADSTLNSPAFIATAAVYDIESGNWYEQPTSTPPGQMTQGCTVLASAQDGSSHNIYWYGGYNGTDSESEFNDDVWVLSVPSFIWMKVSSGTASHARAGHRCTKPYPDQMFVIGGYASLVGETPVCVDGGIIQIFNLSSATWMTEYDPSKWSNYTVPDSITAMIGGSGIGGATQTAPTPNGFSNSSLSTLFTTDYNTSKIATWYPYHATPTSPTNRTSLLPSAVPKSSTPTYLAPVLGVVLGLIFVSLLILAFVLWRRRKYWRSDRGATQSEGGTMDSRSLVSTWLRATPIDAKAPTVAVDETRMTADAHDQESSIVVPEMGGSQVLEMEDTSRPTELQATGFVPLTTQAINSRSRGHGSRVHHSPSTGSQVSQNSSVAPPHDFNNSIRSSSSSELRSDSPLLGDQRVRSGISNLSDAERGHLRGISETSVSTDGTYETPMELNVSPQGQTPTSNPLRERPGVVSPLTPPARSHESGDYLGSVVVSSSGSVREKRKSYFEEKLDEK